MKVLEKRNFVDLVDRGPALKIADTEFRGCCFESCGLSVSLDVAARSHVENVKLTRCSVRAGMIWGAVLEDITVEGLNTRGQLLQIWAAAFRHVVLKGKIGRIMISDVVAPGVSGKEHQHAFDRANAEFYQGVDWALDISEAEFEECDIRGLPSRLVRTDHATQAVVTRKKALEGKWRGLGLEKTYWPLAIQGLLEEGHEDALLVAPKRAKNYRELVDGINLLRKAGVAESS